MDLFDYIEGTQRTLSDIEPITNGIAGLVGEVFEFVEVYESQRPYYLQHETELVDELGDCWFYTATLIQSLPMQMTLENRVNLFFEYYINSMDEEFETTITDHIQNICSMVKKITCHNIDPNAEYKNFGISFNQIFMRHLADLMYHLLQDINCHLPYEKKYTLEEIWTRNLEKLEKRHPGGFSGDYNYQQQELDNKIRDIYDNEWQRDIFP